MMVVFNYNISKAVLILKSQCLFLAPTWSHSLITTNSLVPVAVCTAEHLHSCPIPSKQAAEPQLMLCQPTYSSAMPK